MSEKSATGELREEHEAGLACMRELAAAVAAGATAAKQARPQAEKEIRARLEALRQRLLLHFRKEEEGLYPEVRRIVAEGAPAVDILSQFFGEAADDDLSAHHLLRSRMREMMSLLGAMGRAGSSNGYSTEGLQAVVSASLDLLTRHIEKENRLVFPMIERLLNAAQMAAAAERMRGIAKGFAPSVSE
jgi:hemerythrin-like domain-containing protein